MIRSRPTLHLHSRHLATLALALASTGAAAGGPLYHLTVLEVPDATAVTAKDINDAGQVVGTYSDANFVRHAVLWDGGGWHELALPPGVEVNGIAYAINNSGQIVGTSDDFVNPTVGLLWDAANPGSHIVIGGDTGVHVGPADISDAGIVVGGFGVPSRAFAWDAVGGFVDYGLQDPNVEDQQTRWWAINASGRIVGRWQQHVSNIHATVGQFGTPAVLAMGAMTEEFPTTAVGLNADGIAVGLGLAAEAPDLVPVVFALDGTYTEIPGAPLDQGDGSAIAINDAGVIVGVAGIGTANGPVPGLKAWVHRDGVTHDLYDVVDDTAIFESFSGAVSINAAGVIVGNGRVASGDMMSFMLTPIQGDAIFADGFDPQD
jgi:probable HAF family extracellular repeat protein